MSTSTATAPMLRVHVRYMTRRDIPEVLQIEQAGFDFPWTEDELLAVLRRRHCIGAVAMHDGHVVGFVVYELRDDAIWVLDFAVHPEHRRRGVGHRMVAELVGRLSAERRTMLVAHVRETNLPGQFFLRACGFRAVLVIREYFEDTGEDAYVMRNDFREGDE